MDDRVYWRTSVTMQTEFFLYYIVLRFLSLFLELNPRVQDQFIGVDLLFVMPPSGFLLTEACSLVMDHRSGL